MVGDSSEARRERRSAPEVAEDHPATSGAEVPGADQGALVTAPEAVRMLVGGGGAAIPPNSGSRLGPAALALQRSVGNRALSRRILMRQVPDIATKVPVIPTIGT